MDKNDLYKSSPIRFFEAASNGGLKEGELGLVTAKKGLGKTSVLVQFGMDSLLAGNPLVHVSFDQHSSNVISWYSSVFSEIAKKKNISNASELKDEIMRGLGWRRPESSSPPDKDDRVHAALGFPGKLFPTPIHTGICISFFKKR